LHVEVSKGILCAGLQTGLGSLGTFITYNSSLLQRDRRCRDRMLVGFTTTYAISAYHH